MIVEKYESTCGNLFYDEWGDAHFGTSSVGEYKLPDIGEGIANAVSECAETSLMVAGIGAAAYLVVTEGKNICDYIGSKLNF